MINNQYQKNQGFSLIELMVAASIFVGVMALIGGTFSVFISKQKQQINQQLLQQDVQNFLDTIDREVKTSYSDSFQVVDPSHPSWIKFYNQEQEVPASGGARVFSEYKYGIDNANGNIGRVMYGGNATVDSLTGYEWLTSKRIDVKELNFILNSPTTVVAEPSYLSGAALRITVTIKACVAGESESATSCVQSQATMNSRQTKPIDAP